MKQKKKHVNRVKRHRAMKQGCQVTLNNLVDLRDLASDHGLSIRCHDMRGRKAHRVTLHVIFDFGKTPILHYWPGNGRVWNPATGAKGKVVDAYAALDMAALTSTERLAYLEPVPLNGPAEEEAARLDAIDSRYA